MVVLSLIAQHIFELIHQQQQIPIFALELWKEVEKQEEEILVSKYPLNLESHEQSTSVN